MDGPEVWRWVWLVAAVLFAIGEMATPGSFFLLPFAVGAGVAAGLALLDVSVVVQWAAFVGTSVVALAALRPIARRLDRDGQADGVGSRRLIGQTAVVLEDIEAHGSGLVRVGPEEWRAVASPASDIAAGARVRITDVQGTRVVVHDLQGDSP
ncbi:MAG TPA: NfeD family protein [Acidimicrobiales bacterium]|nr:NfeD family protein [Acidimicrobiales bacterium]